MFRQTYGAALVAAALIVGCPTVASAATDSGSSVAVAAVTHTEGTPYLNKGADPYASDQTTDTAAGADASIVIGDNGAVTSSKGLTAQQISAVRSALATGGRRAAAAAAPAGTGGAEIAAAASIAGASIHHTWHWWGVHAWVDFSTTETNYIYYHSWTIAAVAAAMCTAIGAIEPWAGVGCAAVALVELGRLLDGVDYAHDHHKGLRVDFDITWVGSTSMSVGTH